MRGSDIKMIENRSILSLSPPVRQRCLRQPSRKFGHYLSKPVASSRRDAKFCVSSRRDAIFWAGPELPRKMRPRNILVIFLSKDDQKSLKIWPGRHVQNLGVAFFLEKKRRRQPTPEHMGFFLSGKIQDGLHGMASWRKPHFPKTCFWY